MLKSGHKRYLLGIVMNLFHPDSLLANLSIQSKKQSEVADIMLATPHRALQGLTSYVRLHGLGASAISNMRKPKISLMTKLGFKEFHLRNSEQFEGRIMAKLAKGEPRPTVLFIAGTGMSIDMEVFREFAFPIATDLQWNVILLENHTSGDWIRRNSSHNRLVFSGYESGWDSYLLIQEMRHHPEIAPFISELHLVGLSLGGSDAAFVSYFDSKLKTNFIDGAVLTISAPADRLKGFDDFRLKRGLSGLFVNMLLRDIYAKGEKVYRRTSDKQFDWVLQTTTSTQDVLNELYLPSAQNYFNKHTHHFDDHGIRKIHLNKSAHEKLTIQDYESLFCIKHYIHEITKPFMWVHSQDDPIVSYEWTKSFLEQSSMPKQMSFLPVQYGGHLGLATAYGQDWLLNFMAKYFTYWGRFSPKYYLQWADDHISLPILAHGNSP